VLARDELEVVGRSQLVGDLKGHTEFGAESKSNEKMSPSTALGQVPAESLAKQR
jgi:hypothetical protein